MSAGINKFSDNQTMDELCKEVFGEIYENLLFTTNTVIYHLKNVHGLTILKNQINVPEKEAKIECRLLWRLPDGQTDNFNFKIRIRGAKRCHSSHGPWEYNRDITPVLVQFFRQFGWREEIKKWKCEECEKTERITLDMTLDIRSENKADWNASFEIDKKTSNRKTATTKQEWCTCAPKSLLPA